MGTVQVVVEELRTQERREQGDEREVVRKCVSTIERA